MVGLVALLIALLGQGLATPLLAGVLLSLVLLVTFDLDRPTRGLIRVPETNRWWTSGPPLEQPPAAVAPSAP